MARSQTRLLEKGPARERWRRDGGGKRTDRHRRNGAEVSASPLPRRAGHRRIEEEIARAVEAGRAFTHGCKQHERIHARRHPTRHGVSAKAAAAPDHIARRHDKCVVLQQSAGAPSRRRRRYPSRRSVSSEMVMRVAAVRPRQRGGLEPRGRGGAR